MYKHAVLIGFVMALSTVAPACGSDYDNGGGNPATKTPDGGGEARAVEVSAKDFAFSLAKLDVQPGETIEVTLANADSTEHSFTIDDGVADIEAESGEDAIGAFTAPDKSVEFYCKYHPGKMRGTVNVSGDSSSSSGGGGAGY